MIALALAVCFAHVGTTNVRMGNGKTNNEFDNVYGFNAKYNVG